MNLNILLLKLIFLIIFGFGLIKTQNQQLDTDYIFNFGKDIIETIYGIKCAKECYEVDCTLPTLRYGKYCGIGHTGCPGENPCDSVDACCKKHDKCVEVKDGSKHNICHADFISCIKNAQKRDINGFSTKCPYSIIVPSMEQYIIAAMALSSAYNEL